jgi:hypothetical protein
VNPNGTSGLITGGADLESQEELKAVSFLHTKTRRRAVQKMIMKNGRLKYL